MAITTINTNVKPITFFGYKNLEATKLSKGPFDKNKVWEIKTNGNVKGVLKQIVKAQKDHQLIVNFHVAAQSNPGDGTALQKYRLHENKLEVLGQELGTSNGKKEWVKVTTNQLKDMHILVDSNKEIYLTNSEPLVKAEKVGVSHILS